MLRFIVLLVSIATIGTSVALWNCEDGQHNVVSSVETDAEKPIHFDETIGRTYDVKLQPSCYRNLANLKLPGILKAMSGQVTVKKPMNLVNNSIALLTLRKNSRLIGEVCHEGKSKNVLLSDKDCQFNLCEHFTDLCHVLEKEGVHKLQELENEAGYPDGSITLPQIKATLKPFIRGQWKVEVKFMMGDEAIFILKAPADREWLYLQQ